MANLDRPDQDALSGYECVDCVAKDECCDDACLADLLVGPCTAIDWETGNIMPGDDGTADYSQFCLVEGINSITPNHIIGTRERQRPLRCGPPRRLPGRRDFTIDIDVDRCQSDLANCMLREVCPIALIYVPKYNNFNGDLEIKDQQTEVVWGRFKGGDISDSLEDDSCQTFSRTFQVDGCMWTTKCEALIATAA